MAFRDVYTLVQTFRAENSNTTRHASEFWMIEPEIAFADLEDDMNLIEDMIKYCINYCLENAPEEMKFFEKMIEESEPIYNGLRGPEKLEEARKNYNDPTLRAAFNTSDSVDSAIDIFHLEEEPTKRLMAFCEENHVSLACLLMMGLRTYFQKMNGNDDVSINMAIARRATLKEKSREVRGSILFRSGPSYLGRRAFWRGFMRSGINKMNISAMQIMIRLNILRIGQWYILMNRALLMSRCR